VCVYCASSPAASEAMKADAAALGVTLARAGVRLVYGGGSLGSMGACAGAARDSGGAVLGVIPRFLTEIEPPISGIELVLVESMHERKMMMLEAADAFAILPGAIGTLEEAVEVISWRRLGLHDKPIVFLDPDGFWRPLFELFEAFQAEGLVPADFARCWTRVERVEDLLPAIMAVEPSEASRMARLT
jgi:uncharacterized protein (TIGR00730 family)